MPTFGEIMKKAEESGTSFEVLEAGQYIAKIIESEYKDSTGGKPQIKTRWEVTIGPKAGFKGLWNYFTLSLDSPNAIAIMYRQFVALGITQETLQSLANLDPVTAMRHISGMLLGRSASIKVKVDTEWNNNKIERINPVPPEFATTQSSTPSNPFPVVNGPVAAPVPASTPQGLVAPATAPAAPQAPVDATPSSSSASLPAPPF